MADEVHLLSKTQATVTLASCFIGSGFLVLSYALQQAGLVAGLVGLVVTAFMCYRSIMLVFTIYDDVMSKGSNNLVANTNHYEKLLNTDKGTTKV